MKRCTTCGIDKLIHMFNKNATRPSGLQDVCRECQIKYNKILYYKDHERSKLRNNAQVKKLRTDVINGYGGKCACCEENRYEFLALDHINGGGNEERKTQNSRATYSRVRREGYPPGYQILCHNCNMSIGLYGYCPHKLDKELDEIKNEEVPSF